MTLVRLLGLILGGLGGVACERTPREDVASRPATPVSAPVAPAQTAAKVVLSPAIDPAAGGLSGRCILPTPSTPPQGVPGGPAPGCPPDPEGPSRSTVAARVTFPGAPDAAAVDVEVVRSEHDTMRGLMYRTSLAEGRGMLFDLRARDDHKFWMHNTCIPLDLLYVDDDGLIVGIVENAPTLNDEPRGVGCPSVYVLEVNAGWARHHGIRAGQHMVMTAAGTAK